MGKNDRDYSALGSYYTCPICKKRFFIADYDSWIYKRVILGSRYSKKPLCSWKCIVAFEKTKKQKRLEQSKKHQLSEEDYTNGKKPRMKKHALDYQLIEAVKAAGEEGIDNAGVVEWLNKNMGIEEANIVTVYRKLNRLYDEGKLSKEYAPGKCVARKCIWKYEEV